MPNDQFTMSFVQQGWQSSCAMGKTESAMSSAKA